MSLEIAEADDRQECRASLAELISTVGFVLRKMDKATFKKVMEDLEKSNGAMEGFGRVGSHVAWKQVDEGA